MGTWTRNTWSERTRRHTQNAHTSTWTREAKRSQAITPIQHRKRMARQRVAFVLCLMCSVVCVLVTALMLCYASLPSDVRRSFRLLRLLCASLLFLISFLFSVLILILLLLVVVVDCSLLFSFFCVCAFSLCACLSVGEDPYVIGEFMISLVRGLQEGDDPRYLQIAADCKHYVAYDLEDFQGVGK